MPAAVMFPLILFPVLCLLCLVLRMETIYVKLLSTEIVLYVVSVLPATIWLMPAAAILS